MTQMYNFIDEGSPSGATESYRSSSVTGVFKNVTAEIFLEPKAVLGSLTIYWQYIGTIINISFINISAIYRGMAALARHSLGKYRPATGSISSTIGR